MQGSVTSYVFYHKRKYLGVRLWRAGSLRFSNILTHITLIFFNFFHSIPHSSSRHLRCVMFPFISASISLWLVGSVVIAYMHFCYILWSMVTATILTTISNAWTSFAFSISRDQSLQIVLSKRLERHHVRILRKFLAPQHFIDIVSRWFAPSKHMCSYLSTHIPYLMR